MNRKDQIQVVRFNFTDQALYNQARKIREIVFIDEQNVPAELEMENEEEAQYYLAFLDQKPVACARWRTTKKGIKLERFATLRDYRGKGLAKAILLEIIRDTSSPGYPVFLNAQESAVGFYKKFGFEVEGQSFVEAGIVHYRMILKTNPVL